MSDLVISPSQTKEIGQRKHAKPLTCCRMSPDGKHVFAGAEDLHVYRWRLDDPQAKAVAFSGHESWVRCLDLSADGATLFTAGWDGKVGWWDATSSDPKPQKLIQAHRGFARWIRVSPCGSMLATCGNDLLVKVWDAVTAELLLEFPGHQRHPYAVAFHPTENLLASEDLVGQVHQWDLEKRRQSSRVDASIMTGYDKKFAADMGGARDMCFDAGGATLACAGITHVVNAFAGVQDPLTVLIDWKSQRITHHLRQTKTGTGIAWGIRHHQDGYWIGAIARQNGKGELQFWRIDANEPPAETMQQWDSPAVQEVKPVHTVDLKSAARGLDLTPDQRQLVTAHADGSLRVFDMTNST